MESTPTRSTHEPANREAGGTPPIAEWVERTLQALSTHVPGQEGAARQLLTGFMAGGHVLLEGVPGIGKTRLARSLAEILGLDSKRVQFTPDLMPADITGTSIFDPSSRSFRLLEGPVFTDILLADEINRTPPKTQAALLEAMQEGQVTLDGKPMALPAGFFVVATQNPVELEGTYPLPEAQADRFVLRVAMGLPSATAELEIYRLGLRSPLLHRQLEQSIEAVLDRDQALLLRSASRHTFASEEILSYVQQLAQRVRQDPNVELGVSPRAALSLIEAARAGAWLGGRDFVTPDDVQELLVPCWGHRILLTAEAELEGYAPARLLRRIADQVEVPTVSRADPGAAQADNPADTPSTR